MVEETEAGRRVTLPRLYRRADVMVTVVSTALAVWMGVWVDDLASGFPRPSTLGLGFMAAVGIAFAAVAITEGLRIGAPRVVEEDADGLVLGRRLGVRTVLRHRVPRAVIRGIERTQEAGDGPAGTTAAMQLRTDDHTHVLGRGLDEDTLVWLEAAVRRMAFGGG